MVAAGEAIVTVGVPARLTGEAKARGRTNRSGKKEFMISDQHICRGSSEIEMTQVLLASSLVGEGNMISEGGFMKVQILTFTSSHSL